MYCLTYLTFLMVRLSKVFFFLFFGEVLVSREDLFWFMVWENVTHHLPCWGRSDDWQCSRSTQVLVTLETDRKATRKQTQVRKVNLVMKSQGSPIFPPAQSHLLKFLPPSKQNSNTSCLNVCSNTWVFKDSILSLPLIGYVHLVIKKCI